jgi:uncharacterized NAD-dependent epimerase/dehydratase family protein
MKRRMVLLTEGHSNPHTAKTAAGLLRYCPDECVGVIDSHHHGEKVQRYLGSGGDLTFVSSLDETPTANTLVIGIAPPGGKIPASWRPIILAAIDKGLNVLSGLHDFLIEDQEFREAAERRGVHLIDVRKNHFKEISRRRGLSNNCLRIHTVGHDCSIGKMVVSLEVSRGLERRGLDSHFIATGQTGIMIAGSGLPLDCITADFVAGAAEKLVLENQHHQILVVEGQGSLVHPSYSGVTLSLLHGCLPHALILCFEAGRSTVGGIDHVPIPDLKTIADHFLMMSNIHQPCEIIGIGMNGRKATPDMAREIAQRIEEQMNLPVVDVFRDGPDRLIDAAEKFYRDGRWRKFGM